MIIAREIKKSFGSLQVLKGVNMTVEKGEVVCIAGKSGAGKTTLLQIMGTLNQADSGQIMYNGKDVGKLKDREKSKFRNKNIGFVFQFHHLLPEFTAIENVCIPAFVAKVPAREATNKAREILGFLNLTDRLHHKPNELSGGEQQRVAVARALINNPDVILADEPSGNLDTQNKNELHQLFFSLREKYEQTVVIVTHDKELAAMSDRSLTMKDGVFVDNGS